MPTRSGEINEVGDIVDRDFQEQEKRSASLNTGLQREPHKGSIHWPYKVCKKT